MDSSTEAWGIVVHVFEDTVTQPPEGTDNACRWVEC